MAEWTIRPATAVDARALWPVMRPADAAEVMASGGYTPRRAVEACLRFSADGGEAHALLAAGELLALFGVALKSGRLIPPPFGVGWALTSTAVDRHPREFLAASRAAMTDLLTRWGFITNFIDARHKAALRWASWLGAERYPAIPFGVEARFFHRVTWRAA